jgi:hypothetical protein
VFASSAHAQGVRTDQPVPGLEGRQDAPQRHAWSFVATPANAEAPDRTSALQIGELDDPLEREADWVAERIVASRDCAHGAADPPAEPSPACAQCGGSGAGAPAVRRAPFEAERVGQHSPGVSRRPSAFAPISVQRVLAEPGRGLPALSRTQFEPHFGRSLGHLRIHEGPLASRSSEAIGALAYNVGNHIVFGAGRFQPGTTSGDRLIAHEVVHALQSGAGGAATVRRQPDPAAPGPQCPARAPKDLNRRRGELLEHPLKIDGAEAVYVLWETWQERDTAESWAARAIELWTHWRYGRQTSEQQIAVSSYVHRRAARLGLIGGDASLAHAGCAYALGIDQETLNGARRVSGELQKPEQAPAEPTPPQAHGFRSEVEAPPGAPREAYAMPALGADLDGFEVQPIGSTGVYTMTVHWGEAAGGELGQVAAAGAGAQYTWEVWDISGAPSVQKAEQTVRRRMGLSASPDRRAREVGRGEGASRDLQRANQDLAARPGQIDRDQQAAIDEGRYADAVGDEINRQLLGLEVVTRYGRELLGGLADVTGSDRSRRIPFAAAGAFVVRCVARFDGETGHRRAPSVATKVVVTRSAETASQSALAAPAQAAQESRDTAAVLEQLPGADPAEIARLKGEAANREREASGTPLAIIDAEIAKTDADLTRLRAESALVRVGLRDSKVSDLEDKLDTLRNRRGTLLGREAEMGRAGAAIRRVRAALVSRVTGQTYQLLLEVGEPALVGGRWQCALSDVTTADSHAYEGLAPDTGNVAADKLAATRNALVALAEAGGYGAGSLSYTLPEAPWLAGRSEAQRSATLETRAEGSERGMAGARQRLNEVAAALALLGIIVSGGALGVASGLLGAALAADNIVRRWREGTLHADAQLVGDLLNVLGAVAIGARAIGELAVVDRAGGGIFLRAAQSAGRAVRVAGEVADKVSNVGGLVMANAEFLGKMVEISEQESQGLSPSEARRLRLSAIAGALQNSALVIAGHMREGAGHAETNERARAAGERPAPQRETPAHAGSETRAPGDKSRPAQNRESPSHENTMAGTGAGSAGPPTGGGASATPGAAAHDQWMADTASGGLGRRPPPIPRPGAQHVAPGETRYGLATMADALRVYDDFRARAPGREVGVYRSAVTGEYAVVAGREGAVGRPSNGREGEWGNVLHNHPDPTQSLTLRNPAPADIYLQWQEAARRQAAVTAFIEHDVPGGGRAYTAVTTTPEGHVTIKFQDAEGRSVTQEFSNMAEYSNDWGSRSRYVEPGSPMYDEHMRDLDDVRRQRQSDGNTSSGASPGGNPQGSGPQSSSPAGATGAAPVKPGPSTTFAAGTRPEAQTAGTGGIRSIAKGMTEGQLTVTIEGELRDPLYRDDGPAPAGQTKAPSFEKGGDYARSKALEKPFADHLIEQRTTAGMTAEQKAQVVKQAKTDAAALADNYEAAHLWGPGFGDEAKAGIMFAPKQVNQELQNRLVEGEIRGLFQEAKANGGVVAVRAAAVAYSKDAVRAAGLPAGIPFLEHVEYTFTMKLPSGETKYARVTVSATGPSASAKGLLELHTPQALDVKR